MNKKEKLSLKKKKREREDSTTRPVGLSPGSSNGLVGGSHLLSHPLGEFHGVPSVRSRGPHFQHPAVPCKHTHAQNLLRQKEPPAAHSVLEGPGARGRPCPSPAGRPWPTSWSPISASGKWDIRARCWPGASVGKPPGRPQTALGAEVYRRDGRPQAGREEEREWGEGQRASNICSNNSRNSSKCSKL